MIPTSAHIIFTLFDISLLVVVPLCRVIFIVRVQHYSLNVCKFNNKRNNDSSPTYHNIFFNYYQ